MSVQCLGKYVLFLIIGAIALPMANALQAETSFSSSMAEYRVTQGETLSGISQKLKVSKSLLKHLNDLRGTKIFTGQLLRYPSIKWPSNLGDKPLTIMDYRTYHAKSGIYLCVISKTELEQNILLFKVANKEWHLIEQSSCFGLPYLLFEMHIYVKDIDNDKQDECYIVGAFGCSAKDYCADAFYHVPAVSQQLYGISIITYLLKEDNFRLSYVDNIGNNPKSSLIKYKKYAYSKASQLLDKYFLDN